MRASQNIVARDLHPIKWYPVAALIYLIINLVLASFGRGGGMALMRRS